MHLGFGGHELRYKPVIRPARRSDIVITELSTGAIESSLLCLARPKRVAVWGHGAAFVTKGGRVDSAVEGWMMRRSTHVFLYTEQGQQVAVNAGVDLAKTTVVRNTVDIGAISEATDAMATEDAWRLLGVSPELRSTAVCAFVGGIDDSKRIGFLLEAADLIKAAVPGFALIIGGTGSLQQLVYDAAATRPWIIPVGRVGLQEKAAIGAIARLLLNPGRVGLVAVDSFGMGLPIATTSWRYHAPEFGYLTDGVNAVIAGDDVHQYGEAVIGALGDEVTLRRLSGGCRAERDSYSMAGMIERFRHGIHVALDASESGA